MLLVETGRHSQWDCPATIKLLPGTRSGHRPAVVYELVSRAFFKGPRPEEPGGGTGHFISRLARQMGTKKTPVVYHYDDIANQGMLKLIPDSTVAKSLAGKDDDLVPPLQSGFRTQAVLYVLKHGRDAQKRFYEHQLEDLESQDLDISLTSRNVNEIPVARISVDNPFLRVIPDSERLWISPRQPSQLVARTDYESLPPEEKFIDLAGSSLSSSSTSALSIDLQDPAARGESNVVEDHRSRSPHPVRCRCGVLGDGNLMIDGLNTVECHICKTFSHIACQRHGRANDLAPGEDFECDECLGLDTGLPPSDKQ